MLAVNYINSEDLEATIQYLKDARDPFDPTMQGYHYFTALYKPEDPTRYLLISSTESQEEADDFARQYIASGWVLVGAEPEQPPQPSFADWLPASPLVGPPLPVWLGITWPWYKPQATST